ncbi:MAG: hypothetical protein FWG50_12015 [Kiritimatiellaeota bacterium]|nr:hypothetical protein [Kiritimatiellota bacterium]
MKTFVGGLLAGIAVITAQTGLGAAHVAGSLLVDVAASDAAGVGDGNAVASLQNKGALGGTFGAWGAGPGATYRASVRGAPALWFDGTTNTVLVSSLIGTPSQLEGAGKAWSAEFWVLNPSLNMSSGDFMSWTRRPSGNAANTLVEFRYGSSASLIEHYSGNLNWNVRPPQALWHHVVVTRDNGNTERIYVDGEPDNAAILASLNVRPDGRMVFGATLNLEDDDFQFPYYGYIGQARIHSGTLTAQQVAENYLAELPAYTYAPYPDGTALVDVNAGDLTALANGAFVQSWPDNGVLASSFASVDSTWGPTFHADVQGAPAVLFDASTSNALVGAAVPADLTANPTYTLEVWLNCPEFLTREAIFLSWTPCSSIANALMEFRYYSSYIFGEHYNAYTRWPNDVPPPANQWHHIATTRDAATGETLIYINGILRRTQTVNNLSIRSDGRFILGGAELNDPRAGIRANWGYNGYIGALRVSTGVKREMDIITTYSAEAPAYGLTPILLGSDAEWVNPSGGDWSEPTNWDPQTPVNGATRIASFKNGGGSVVNDIPGLTLHGLLFGDPATDVSGNAITLASGGVIWGYAQTNTISAPLVLGGPLTASFIPGGNGLILSGGISGTGPLVTDGGNVILSGNNALTGGVTHRSGTLEVGALAALGTGPLTLGDGTFRYTGPNATHATTLRTETLPSRGTVIDLTDPAATLELPAAFDGNAPLLKRGPGTLALSYGGPQQLTIGSTSIATLYETTPDGILAMPSGSFDIEEGTVSLGAPGQVNTINLGTGQSSRIGTRWTPSPAELHITGGTTVFSGGSWLGINRGSPYDAAVRVSGADTLLQVNIGVVMAFADGLAGHNSASLLDIDAATVTVSGPFYLGESALATSTLSVRNGGTFESNQANSSGMEIPRTHNAASTLEASGGSTVRINHLSVNAGGTLAVTGGARLENDLPSTTALLHNHATYAKGTARFDNGTYAQRTADSLGLWLYGTPRLLVGDGGATLDVSGRVTLDATLTDAPGAATATAVKTGTGTLLTRPPATAVNVAQGTLELFSTAVDSYSNPPPEGTVAMGGGEIAAMTDGALLNQTLLPNGTDTLHLHTPATQRFWGMWQTNFNPAAAAAIPFVREDGWLRFANNTLSHATSFFLRDRQRVTGPWTVCFTFIGEGIGADGFAFVIHNDARGPIAIGGTGANVGFSGAITNSVGVIFDTYNPTPGRIRLGKSTGATVTVSEVKTMAAFSLKDNMVKTFITLSHDGAGNITCTLRRPDGAAEICTIPNVDIFGQVGDDDMAYIGFTGATGGATIRQGWLGEITFDDGMTPEARQNIVQYGGNVALGDGTLNARLENATPWQCVSALDTLTFADGATLNVDTPVRTYAFPPESPNLLLDTGAWAFNGAAIPWSPGSIRVTPTSALNGTFFSKTRYDVASAWTARLTYQMGTASVDPADFITFTIQNLSPDEEFPVNTSPWKIADGLTVEWDYYSQRNLPANGDNNTRLGLYINGVLVGPTVNGLGNVKLRNQELTYMTLVYDPVGRTLTVTTEQPGINASHTHTFANVNIADILGAPGDGKAYIGCTGRSGGQWAEDIISSLTFDNGTPDLTSSALAFRRYDGTGTVNHQGNAALALLGDADYAPDNVSLRLSGGGLNLRRANDEPFGTVANRGEWVALTTNTAWHPRWSDNGDAFITTATTTTEFLACGFASARRVNVARDFTADFTYVSSSATADGFCLAFHNDTRGNAALGVAGSACGYQGGGGIDAVRNSLAVRFNIYSDPSQISLARNGGGWGDTRSLGAGGPPFLRNTVTRITARYDASAHELTLTLSNNLGTATEVFTGVDIATDVGGGLATLLFGGGTGSLRANQYICDFILDYPAPITSADERHAVGGTEIPGGQAQAITLDAPTVANPAFLITDGLFGDGATLRLASKTGGALRYANATLDGAAALDIQNGVTLTLQNISGMSALDKTGGGGLILSGAGADATLGLAGGNTDLSALAVNTGTVLDLSGGATVSVGAGNKIIIGGGSLDGIKLPAGIYKPDNATWVTSGQVNIGSIGTIILLK